jgi:hypothetical protein
MQKAAAIALALLTLRCSDVVTERFASATEARNRGAFRRGLLPSFVPTAASELVVAPNVDTNEIWVRFTAPLSALKSMESNVVRVGWAEARAGTREPGVDSAPGIRSLAADR